MTEPRPEWDDARLEAAFTARAARGGPPPGQITDAVMDRVSDRSPRRVRPWVAAAAGVALLVAIGGVLGVRPGRIVPPTSASMSPGSSVAGKPNPTSALPSSLGDPISVEDALAVRDSGSNREVVVAGFLSPLLPIRCPLVRVADNPTFLRCPQSRQYVMSDPAQWPADDPSSGVGAPSQGPALHPSFALVDPPGIPIPRNGAVRVPVAIELVGHFHDRRAVLCGAEPAPPIPCADIFVVDRVASVNGEPRGVVTQLRNQRFDDATQKEVTEPPKDLVEDVDVLSVAQVPGGSVLSRQLVTLDQVTAIEPILADDEVIPYVGNPATLFWLVTILDEHADPPVARTFLLDDGSNLFGEVTSAGLRRIERNGTAAPPTSPARPIASADPAAFASAPDPVLGIPVRDVFTTVGDRRAATDQLGRDEIAIRAWYVAPNPAAVCADPLPAIHAPSPPCDEARAWLLDDPTQYGTEVGQVRRDPDPWPRVLNPIVPVDVTFEPPPSWVAGQPTPQPVVVLGHFLDHRINAFAGSNYFVVDALAWSRSGTNNVAATVARLSGDATEDAASVLSRIDRASGTPAVATWTTAVASSDFGRLEPEFRHSGAEFTSGPPIWVVRRLVPSEINGRQRLAIQWAYATDTGDRVWLTPTPDSDVELATSLDLVDLDARTDVVRVFDYERQIVSVTRTSGLDTLSWKPVGPDPLVGLQVARGRSDREVAMRWTGADCQAVWSIQVQNLGNGEILVEPRAAHGACNRDPVDRRILVTFDHPVDLDRVRTGDPCCG